MSRRREEGGKSIALLKSKNRMLRAEIKRLHKTLLIYSNQATVKSDSEKSRDEKLLATRQKHALSLASTSYLSYLRVRFTKASFYGFFKKTWMWFSKLRLVSTVIRIVSSVFAIIGTGAFFIFVSGVIIFIIPFAAAFAAAVYLTSIIFRKKAFKELTVRISGKNIFVFFPSRGRPFEPGSCFLATVDAILCRDPQNYVIIVSPYFISSKGFCSKARYLVARFDGKRTCTVRQHAFFALRRKILSKFHDQTNYIY